MHDEIVDAELSDSGIDASDVEEVDPEELAAILEEDGGGDDDDLAAQEEEAAPPAFNNTDKNHPAVPPALQSQLAATPPCLAPSHDGADYLQVEGVSWMQGVFKRTGGGACSFDAAEGLLIVGQSSGAIVIADRETREVVQALPPAAGVPATGAGGLPAVCVKMCPLGRYLVAAYSAGEGTAGCDVKIWGWKRGSLVKTVEKRHRGAVTMIEFVSASRFLTADVHGLVLALSLSSMVLLPRIIVSCARTCMCLLTCAFLPVSVRPTVCISVRLCPCECVYVNVCSTRLYFIRAYVHSHIMCT